MTTTGIPLRRVEQFLTRTLPVKLHQDLLQFKIIKEADLESCVYYHLRKFVHRDSNWRILARKHSPQTGHFIDILIFRKQIPRIAIELKWNEKSISKKDRESLGKSLTKFGVNKAYFITTLVGDKEYRDIRWTEIEKNRLIEIVVQLVLPVSKLKIWKAERDLYKSRMLPGKRAQA